MNFPTNTPLRVSLFLGVTFLVLTGAFSGTSAGTLPFFQATGNLEVHLLLEENADDSSGNNNHGTAGGDVTWSRMATEGRWSAVFGEQDTGQITLPNSAMMNSGTAVTVCFWIKTDGIWGADASSPDNVAAIVERHSPGKMSGFHIVQHPPGASSAGVLELQVYDNNGLPLPTPIRGGKGAVLHDNGWHHVAAVVSHTVGFNRLYIDGTLANSGASLGSFSYQNPTMHIGKSMTAEYEEWRGHLDSFRLYNTELTADQIATIYDKEHVTVSVEAADSRIPEDSSQPTTLVFSRTGTLYTHLSVTFQVTGTATSGKDYEALETVKIVAGYRSKSITVTPIEDSLPEGDETITVTVVATDLYDRGDSPSDTITITEDGSTGSQFIVRIRPDKVAREPDKNGRFIVNRIKRTIIPPEEEEDEPTIIENPYTKGSVLIQYGVSGTATPGSDYEPLSGNVIIPDGSDSAYIPVNVIDSAEREKAENVIVALTLASDGYTVGDPGKATLLVKDEHVDNDGDRDSTQFLCSAGTAGKGSASGLPLIALLMLAGFLAARRRL